jgi:hypothetical protein
MFLTYYYSYVEIHLYVTLKFDQDPHPQDPDSHGFALIRTEFSPWIRIRISIEIKTGSGLIRILIFNQCGYTALHIIQQTDIVWNKEIWEACA